MQAASLVAIIFLLDEKIRNNVHGIKPVPGGEDLGGRGVLAGTVPTTCFQLSCAFA